MDILRSFREGKDGITDFGLFHQSVLPIENKVKIPLVKYHQQKIEDIDVNVVIKDNKKSSSEWYSAILYQQRNGIYVLKFKQTEIIQ